jgi:hypothetical protein
MTIMTMKSVDDDDDDDSFVVVRSCVWCVMQ